MLSAIDLNDDLESVGCEVGEVRSDGGLPSKVTVVERRLSQMTPHDFFGFGDVTAQRSRTPDACIGRPRTAWRHRPPTPDPSPPQAGGGEQNAASASGRRDAGARNP
jgi:hypothetical protein